MPKTYMDLKESQYNEIGENVYDKIETELPLENKNVYEQLVADISLNEIGFVIIDKGKDNTDGFKKELAVSAYKKVIYVKNVIMTFSQTAESLLIRGAITCFILHINIDRYLKCIHLLSNNYFVD